MSTHPIGIFDSGIGGTSIFKEVHKLLPNENIIYLADSKNAPYGEKSKEDIIELCIKNTELLLKKGCKIIIVACNTATTNAIDYLREKYPIPFIGIEPAIKPAALKTKTKAIGILATKGTLSSALFHKTTDVFAKNITIIEQIGKGIVELIEAGELESNDMKKLLERYLEPMLKGNIDYLVLGCTHYPYLIPKLKEILPKHITIIDSGLAVAKQTLAVLKNKSIFNLSDDNPKIEFYTNGNCTILSEILNAKHEVFTSDF